MYIWDEFSRFGDVLLETDALGGVTTGYTYGMEGILAQETSGGYAYMLKDVHGSVRLLTDALDAVTASYAYDAYGETIHESGAAETNYRYNGQQYDKLTGNYSLRARYYAPQLGRFLSRDKHQSNYENELNRYVYVAANPVMWSDPSGYSALLDMSVIKLNVSNVASAGLRQFFVSTLQGGIGALVGTVVGAMFLAISTEILHEVRGEGFYIERIIDNFRNRYLTTEALFINFVTGLALGAENFLTQKSVLTFANINKLLKSNNVSKVRQFAGNFSNQLSTKRFWRGIGIASVSSTAFLITEGSSDDIYSILGGILSTMIIGLINQRASMDIFYNTVLNNISRDFGSAFAKGVIFGIANTTAYALPKIGEAFLREAF